MTTSLPRALSVLFVCVFSGGTIAAEPLPQPINQSGQVARNLTAPIPPVDLPNRVRTRIDEFGRTVSERQQWVFANPQLDQWGNPVLGSGSWRAVWLQEAATPVEHPDFEIPAWAVGGTRPGYTVSANPQPQLPPSLHAAAFSALFANSTGGNQQLVHVHYRGEMVLGPQQVSDQDLVVEMRDGRTGATRFWDVELVSRPNGRWVMSVRNELAGQKTDPGKSVVLSQTPVGVTFTNDLHHSVQLVWVDYSGIEKDYGNLPAHESKSFDTGHGALWRFKKENQVVGFYQANREVRQSWRIGDNMEKHAEESSTLERKNFSKPEWVLVHESASGQADSRYDFRRDPDPAPNYVHTIVEQLEDHGNPAHHHYQLTRVHYYLRRNPAANEYRAFRLPENLVIETRDRDSGQKEFWDIHVSFTNGRMSWSSRRLPMVSPDPPSIDTDFVDQKVPEYQRPSWTYSATVPGGIAVQDANSPEAYHNAGKAIAKIREAGRDVDLVRVLHSGNRNLYPNTHQHMVLQVVEIRNGFQNPQVWEVELIRSEDGRAQVQWHSLQ